jgi:hypothetical protein
MDWLTKSEAAAVLGTSEKTVQTLAKGGKIQEKWRINEGTNKRARVYHPGDVDRERKARNAGKPFVMPEEPVAVGKALEVLQGAGKLEMLEKLLAASNQAHAAVIEKMLTRLPAPAPGPKEWPMFLTLAQAVEYSGLPRRVIKDAMRRGLKTMAIGKTRRKISRTGLETYFYLQAEASGDGA